MNLVKYEPFTGLRPFSAELDRMFRFDEDFGLNLFRPFSKAMNASALTPSVDVWETEDKVVAEVECAGLTPKDIDISVEGNTLILKGEKQVNSEDVKNSFHVMERSYGSFTRSFSLPSAVDTETISATAKNGVVRIEMAKKPEYKPKKVEVKELTE